MTGCAQFAIEFDFGVDGTTLWVHGPLDADSVPAFAAALATVHQHGARFVTLVLSGLRSCNVGGLRAMTELAARLHARDGSVTLVDPWILTPMIDITDLRSMFALEEEHECLDRLPRGA